MKKHFVNKALSAALLGCGLWTAGSAVAAVPDSVYLMAYNVHAGGGLNFAWSANRQVWKGIGPGHAFIKSDFGTWGPEKKMYHPNLIQMPDGTWRCVFQVNDYANQFAVAYSADLVKWQPQDYPYMEGVNSCIAPVLSYDAATATYKVVFKTKDGGVYETVSKDFYHFSKPRKVDASVYPSVTEQALVDGQPVNGQVFKVPYAGVERMVQAVESAAYWAALNGELARDNEVRFQGLKPLEATIKIDAGRTKKISDKLIGMFFEDMGVTYLGPVDGHDIEGLIKVIEEAKRVKGAVLIHVLTQKGKGYGPAEKHPARFHGAEPFDIETGIPSHPRTVANYTDVFSTVMCKLGQRDERVVAITAAMPDGTGLKRFRNMYPDRFFDVGIAEEHAVTFAAGLAAGGMKPIVAVYSSFLQRAYDQILHDVCIQNLPVVFAIDRAGLVGSDGETHQGIFDYTYLSGIPNMHICAPKNKWELSDMMKFAVALEAPIAVRYPRGTAYAGLAEYRAPIELGKAEWIVREGGIALFAVGSMVKTAEEVQALLHEKGYRASIINARFIKPIDEEAVLSACEDHDMIVTMEENVLSGGFGQKVLTCLNDHDRQIKCVMAGIPDAYVEHGNVDLLKKEIGLDAVSITEKILEKL